MEMDFDASFHVFFASWKGLGPGRLKMAPKWVTIDMEEVGGISRRPLIRKAQRKTP